MASDRIAQFEASPYHHGSVGKNRADLIAGYGIWDRFQEEWWIEDGFATLEAAQAAADRVNQLMWAIEDDVRAHWQNTPHGLAAGDVKCEICDPLEDHD